MRANIAAIAGGILAITASGGVSHLVRGQELPRPAQVKTVEMFRVPKYCEGVCFDHDGNGYISWGKAITRFTLDGKHVDDKHSVWAETGAPNGHKVLADGTHLV